MHDARNEFEPGARVRGQRPGAPRTKFQNRIRFVGVLCLVAAGLGCAQTPPARVLTRGVLEEARFAPSAADSESSGAESADVELVKRVEAPPSLALHVTAWVTDAPLPTDLDPLAASARPIANPDSESRFLAVAQLSRGVRLALDSQAESVRDALAPQNQPSRAVGLWPKVSTRVSWTKGQLGSSVQSSTGRWKQVELQATMGKSADPSFVLLFHGIADAPRRLSSAPPESSITSEPPEVALTEAVQLRLPTGTQSFLAWIPIAGAASTEALALLVTVADGSSLSAETLQQQRARFAEQAAVPEIQTVWDEFSGAIENLRWRASQRRALAHLAESTGGSLTRDFALSAPQPFLGRSCTMIRNQLLEGDPPETLGALGFQLERATYLALAQQLDDGLPPEVEAALVLHAGQVGRDPSAIAEVFTVATELDDLPRVFGEANFIGLRDARASARARALDWLRRHDRAPANFDPLGPSSERRAALRAAVDSWNEDEANTPPSSSSKVPSAEKAGS